MQHCCVQVPPLPVQDFSKLRSVWVSLTSGVLATVRAFGIDYLGACDRLRLAETVLQSALLTIKIVSQHVSWMSLQKVSQDEKRKSKS